MNAPVPSSNQTAGSGDPANRYFYVPPSGDEAAGYWVDGPQLGDPNNPYNNRYSQPGVKTETADGTPYIELQIDQALQIAKDYVPHVPTDEDRLNPKRYARMEFSRAGYSNVHVAGGPVDRWATLVDADKGPNWQAAWQAAIKAVTLAYSLGTVKPKPEDKPARRLTVAETETAREKGEKDAAAAAAKIAQATPLTPAAQQAAADAAARQAIANATPKPV